MEKSAPVSMDELLQLYRDFGLPLPPGAPLVLSPRGAERRHSSDELVPSFLLGFLLKPQNGNSPAEFLFGPVKTMVCQDELLPVQPEEVDARRQ